MSYQINKRTRRKQKIESAKKQAEHQKNLNAHHGVGEIQAGQLPALEREELDPQIRDPKAPLERELSQLGAHDGDASEPHVSERLPPCQREPPEPPRPPHLGRGGVPEVDPIGEVEAKDLSARGSAWDPELRCLVGSEAGRKKGYIGGSFSPGWR